MSIQRLIHVGSTSFHWNYVETTLTQPVCAQLVVLQCRALSMDRGSIKWGMSLITDTHRTQLGRLVTCDSVTLDRPLAHTRARTRDPLHTSTTVTHEASLPIVPQKPRPLQSKGNYYFKVSEKVTSPIETLFSAHHRYLASRFTSITPAPPLTS